MRLGTTGLAHVLVLPLIAVTVCPAAGQITTRNPLDEIVSTLKSVLAASGVPFSEAQEARIALFLQDRKNASEELFGQVLDFRGGPPEGRARERALAAIQWINQEFDQGLNQFLTPAQRLAWAKARAGSTGGLEALKLLLSDDHALTEEQESIIAPLYASMPAGRERNDGILRAIAGALTVDQREWILDAERAAGAPAGATADEEERKTTGETEDGRHELDDVVRALRRFSARPEGALAAAATGRPAVRGSQHVQQVRIYNNPFTAETGGSVSRGGPRTRATEVIQRGGTGAYHGTFAFTFQDEALNARNPFAPNKPPYMERDLDGSFSGPLIRERLTLVVNGNQNRQENVDTVNALTPDGLVSLGIVRPSVQRSVTGRGIWQLADPHSVHFSHRYHAQTRRNQGVGGFTLPERATNSDSRNISLEARQISIVADRTAYEQRVGYRTSRSETKPLTRRVAVNVLDAFRGGGAQSDTERTENVYEIRSLVFHDRTAVSFRAGFEGVFGHETTATRDNFGGAFTFSDLDSLRAGRPINYRQTQGDPLLTVRQFEAALFVQGDVKLSERMRVMLGGRYEVQTNLDDWNNLDPRVAVAYAVGGSTVIRGGTGIFRQRVGSWIFRDVLRLDGQRQQEIVITDPSYPDPFRSGAGTVIPPSSVRVLDARLVAPYHLISSASIEHRLPANVLLTGSYDLNAGANLLRTRNLNAPPQGSTIRPDPSRGNVLNLEATARSRAHTVQLGYRQRFRLLNVSGTYTFASVFDEVEGPFSLPSNNYDLRADWGRAGGVQRHQFSSSVNAQLPLGLYLTTVTRAHSGSPYNITTGHDDNHDTHVNDRPAGVPRNSGNGPRFLTTSVNLSKAVNLRHRPRWMGGALQFQVFANANNAFNRTNYGTPSGVMTSPFFGRPTSARSPREIEIGMRAQF